LKNPVFFNQKALYVRKLVYMTDYTLSKEKIAELEKLHRSLREKRQADRVKAVIALSKG
jgi:hypothetical protein